MYLFFPLRDRPAGSPQGSFVELDSFFPFPQTSSFLRCCLSQQDPILNLTLASIHPAHSQVPRISQVQQSSRTRLLRLLRWISRRRLPPLLKLAPAVKERSAQELLQRVRRERETTVVEMERRRRRRRAKRRPQRASRRTRRRREGRIERGKLVVSAFLSFLCCLVRDRTSWD